MGKLPYKFVKYISVFLVIFAMLKYVIRINGELCSDMSNVGVSMIFTLVYMIIDNLDYLFVKDVPVAGGCDCSVSEYEHMTSGSSSNMEHMTNDVQNPIIMTHVANRAVSQEATQEQRPAISSTVPNAVVDTVDATPDNVDTAIIYKTASGGITRNSDGSYTYDIRKDPQIKSIGSRKTDGTMHTTDIKYNYTDYNVLPPNLNTGSFEAGYSFLPPANWYPVPPHPPVCITEKECPVCPVYTGGTNIELKEWDDSRRVMPPDNINTQYIEEKLNSGR